MTSPATPVNRQSPASARQSITLFTPAGTLTSVKPLRLAAKRLLDLGFAVTTDESAGARQQRFGGSDDVRLAALHRVAASGTAIAMATRGGYGLSRLLDRIDWPLLARSVDKGMRWVGYSDMTTLQLGLLAHSRSPSWAGPMAADDFGCDSVDEVTSACFVEAMEGELEAVGFRTEPGFDGLDVRGTLWGGNLTMVCSLLGTPHMPRVKGGVLFLEDVNEHPYRVERHLLQLLSAGVMEAQKAVVLGHFSAWKPSALDRGYNLKSAITALRERTKVPVLTGLPFGHVATKVTLPVGRRIQMVVQGRDVLIGW